MASTMYFNEGVHAPAPFRNPQSSSRAGRAQVKPWVDEVLQYIGPYLHNLSDQDRATLFRVIPSNVGRIGLWKSHGDFNSLDALKAKVQDWRRRGL
jgi:hypothetical protein